MKAAQILTVFALSLASVQAIPTRSSDVIQARGPKPLGSACTSSTTCSTNLFCNRNKCDTKKADGQACYKNIGCSSNVCSLSSKICLGATNRALNAECTASSQCASGYCGKSKCAAKLANGQTCYKDAGCVSGRCLSNTCTSADAVAQLLPLKAQCKTSAACSSGLCEYSKCAKKKANGQACYKNVACASGFCKDGKTCAAATATATPTPVVLQDGSFSSGNLNAFTVSGDVSAVKSADCLTDGSCAQFSVPSGGEASLVQALSSASTQKRQQGSNVSIWAVNYYYKIKSFSATTSGAACRVYTQINDAERTLGATFTSMPNPSVWTRQYAETQSVYLSRAGAVVDCDQGATMALLLDNLAVLNLQDYRSSSSAGLSPTGFSTPPGVSDLGTATLTGTGSITTNAPTATPDPASNLILTDGSFDSGNLNAWQIKDNIAAFASSTCLTGGRCAKFTVPEGGNATLQQTLTRVQARALQKRGPTWVSHYYLLVTEFQSVNASDYGHVCRYYDLMDGIRTSFNTISDVTQYGWYSSGGSDFGSTLQSIGLQVVCDPGASTTMLIDDVQFLNTITFESSYSAGLSPTGFYVPPETAT